MSGAWDTVKLPIGEYRTTRLACTDDTHLPGCLARPLGVTSCMCGRVWWVGDVGVWKSEARHAPDPPAPSLGIGIGAPGLAPPAVEFYGWDTYYLHAQACPVQDVRCPCAPTCGEEVPTDYATAVKAAREARA